MMHKSKKLLSLLTMALVITASLTQPALAAGVSYMPDVTAEMSDASYWANLSENAQEVILTPEEIEAYNRDTELASGTMVMDLKSASETFDGKARNEAIRTSATADAQYYFGWTYGADGKKAEWSYYEKMIKNCIDPRPKRRWPCAMASPWSGRSCRCSPARTPSGTIPPTRTSTTRP